MQKIVNKIFIGEDIFYKILNVINDQVVNINIYKKVKDSYREIMPDEVDATAGKALMVETNNIVLTKEELKDFTWKIDQIIDRHKHEINLEVVKKFNIKGMVCVISSFAGITYAVVSFIDKPYMEIVKIVLDENGKVRKISPLVTNIIDLVISDVATKISLKEKPKFIQITHTTIYSIKRDGKTIVISELGIGAEDVLCQKAFAIHVENNKYRLYGYDEVDEVMSNKIKNITKNSIEDLMRAILIDVLKKAED